MLLPVRISLASGRGRVNVVKGVVETGGGHRAWGLPNQPKPYFSPEFIDCPLFQVAACAVTGVLNYCFVSTRRRGVEVRPVPWFAILLCPSSPPLASLSDTCRCCWVAVPMSPELCDVKAGALPYRTAYLWAFAWVNSPPPATVFPACLVFPHRVPILLLVFCPVSSCVVSILVCECGGGDHWRPTSRESI